MAEEAFALSPISASAAVPTEADYHAIREAFMETARGRWFLTEYAKRNRNADTAMVLEAVARIEQSISTAAQAEAAAAPASETLPEAALAALENARTAIRDQFSEKGFDRTLLPWRKSARIIREIVWGLRESGADPRICNILDGQVRAIETACDDFPLEDIRDRMLAALDAALSQDHEAAPVMAEAASSAPAAETVAEAAPAAAQASEPPHEHVVGNILAAEAAAEDAATPVEAAAAEAAPVEPPVVEEAPVAEALAAEPLEIVTAEAVSAEAVTAESPTEETAAAEPVAAMAASSENIAPDASSLIEDIVGLEDIVEPEAAQPPVAAAPEIEPPAPLAPAPRSIMTASAAQPAPQPMAEPAPTEAPSMATEAAPPHVGPAPDPAATVAVAQGGGSEDLWADIESEIAPLPPFDPAHEASLGASLIAQGVVARPSNGRADLLAPIRRMSHAERIAFFS